MGLLNSNMVGFITSKLLAANQNGILLTCLCLLFLDCMGRASCIAELLESTSEKGKIHVSQETIALVDVPRFTNSRVKGVFKTVMVNANPPKYKDEEIPSHLVSCQRLTKRPAF